MKKIRRMRIRTESSKIVFIKNQTKEESLHDLETCPTCGQQLAAPVKTAALLPACTDIHGENLESIVETRKQEK